MRNRTGILFAFGGLGLGAMIGMLQPTHTASIGQRAALPASERSLPTMAAPQQTIDDEAALRGEIGAILRDELGKARPETERVATVAATPPSQESLIAHEQSQSLVARAVSVRHWTRDDAETLRRLLPHMTDEQRDEAFHTLLPAINRGEITLDFTGSPL